ncbi:Bax inhibitor-1/YccA family protein [Emcibacter nanhaiensis]|uniref:Bax inhibitor-1/YccA family protein n=1 Tax=Emcibacter nanhaiensis TaxID=1505037 RepID=A0A501PAF6_9PROT|nr:Bax inhibitor-1/YccA family protein [Emcibacter nanhaiensis]TPD57359.1 Bax inhibitor-1/YccA family protein [Emcibacter nanhaiensis]
MVDRNTQYSPTGVRTAAEIDAGLRSYMLTVYNYMTIALALTGFVALGVFQVPALQDLFYQTAMAPDGSRMLVGVTGLGYIAMFSPLAFVLVLSFGINRMQSSTAQLVFWAFAAVFGLSLSNIFLVYSGTSIARTFFVTAAAFGGLSLYGYTTKKSLSAFGSFLVMGLFGLIIAMLVNMFLQSTMMQFVISVAGVLIFAGLTAYDTQKIKLMYLEDDHPELARKKAIMGALTLYLDFINLFMFLLRFMGNRE